MADTVKRTSAKKPAAKAKAAAKRPVAKKKSAPKPTVFSVVKGGGIYYNSGETYWRRNTAYFTVDSYTTLFLMASYQVTEDLKLQLNVDNLTDEEYVVDYSAKGHFRPGNPRSVAVFANYTF